MKPNDTLGVPEVGEAQERIAFEAWVLEAYGEHPRRSGDSYASQTISDHWMAWRARAAYGVPEGHASARNFPGADDLGVAVGGEGQQA